MANRETRPTTRVEAVASARTKQTDYETLLPVHHASRIGNVFLNTAKVVFQAHLELTRRASKMRQWRRCRANPRLVFADSASAARS